MMTRNSPFTLGNPDRTEDLTQATAHLPAPEDVTADPTRCWNAILNTSTNPSKNPLFIRTISATTISTSSEGIGIFFGIQTIENPDAVLAHIFPVAGTPFTFQQVLSIHDALWQPTPTIDDVHNVLRDNEITIMITDLQTFTTELDAAFLQARTMLKHVGSGGFSYHSGIVQGKGITISPNVATDGNMIPAIWDRIYAWGATKGKFKSFATTVRFTDRNYMFALSGLDLDPDHYPSRKQVLLEILQSVTAAANTETEKAAVQVMIGRTTAATDNSPELPTLAEIMSLGMQEARAAGNSDWIGRRGLTSIGQTFHLRFQFPQPA